MPPLLAAERMTFYLPYKFVVDCAAQALFERHGWYKVCFLSKAKATAIGLPGALAASVMLSGYSFLSIKLKPVQEANYEQFKQ